MKKLFTVLLALVSLVSFAQVKISDMPTYSGDPNTAAFPVVVDGKNYKVFGSVFAKATANLGKIDSISLAVPFGVFNPFTFAYDPITKTSVGSLGLKTQGGPGGTTVFASPIGSVAGAPLFRTLSFSDLQGSLSWSSVSNRPTTIAGYGITDAMSQAFAEAIFAPIFHVHDFTSLLNRPTTLLGYGITDAQDIYHNSYLNNGVGDGDSLLVQISDSAGKVRRVKFIPGANVTITTAHTGDQLNYTIAAAAGGGASLSGLTTGNIPFASSPTSIAPTGSGANGLFWDNTNSRVGINKSAPTLALDVTGSIQASQALVAGGNVSVGGTLSLFGQGSVGAGANPYIQFSNGWSNLGSWRYYGGNGGLLLFEMNGGATNAASSIKFPILSDGLGTDKVLLINNGQLKVGSAPGTASSVETAEVLYKRSVTNKDTLNLGFSTYTSTYDVIKIELTGTANTNAINLFGRTSAAGTTFDAAAASYAWQYTDRDSRTLAHDFNSDDHMEMSLGLSNTQSIRGTIVIRKPATATEDAVVEWDFHYLDGFGKAQTSHGTGVRLAAAAVGSLQLYLTGSALWTSASYKVIGLKN